MVLAILVLVFMVLGLAYACAYLYGHYRRAMRNEETAVQMADQALQEKNQWETYGLAVKEENEILGQYRPIVDVDLHVRQLKAQIDDQNAELNQAKELLTATRNIVEGYGNEYLVPKESLFDQMAADYGHENAGRKLKEARDKTRRMIREGTSASSTLENQFQNEAAKDFLVDAFNGRVEGVLNKAKKLSENYGVLKQQIIDARAVVNESGRYFGTTITESFLEARIDELKWAVRVQEIIEEEREEQRILKERLRDEALARKEAEKARSNIF